MNELPVPIREFILDLIEEDRQPAYLLVNEDNALAEWGGDLSAYGVSDLRKGSDVTHHIPFTVGLLPLEGNSVFLPNMQTDEESYADIYVFKRAEGTWVLLLDATSRARKRQALQQKASDLRLQVADLEKDEKKLLQIQNALELMVRERTSELSRANLLLKRELMERGRAEAARRETEARFRTLFESNLLGVAFWDSRGVVAEANEAFLRTLGYAREDLDSGALRWERISPPGGNAQEQKALDEMGRTGVCAPYLRRFLRKDGSAVTLLFSAAFLDSSRTNFVCYVLDLSNYTVG